METMVTNRRLLEVGSDIFVGTYDIDFAGHVSNIVYLRWFEALRLQIFDKYYPLEELMGDGFLPIISAHYVEYKRAVNLFDKPTGHMWIDSIQGVRIKFKGEIRVGGELATYAEHTGIFIAKSTMKPVKIPQKIMTLLKKDGWTG